MAQEVLVSVVPLTLRIVRGRGKGELRILAESFDPIEVKRRDKIILRPEGHGVVIERENRQADSLDPRPLDAGLV